MPNTSFTPTTENSRLPSTTAEPHKSTALYKLHFLSLLIKGVHNSFLLLQSFLSSGRLTKTLFILSVKRYNFLQIHYKHLCMHWYSSMSSLTQIKVDASDETSNLRQSKFLQSEPWHPVFCHYPRPFCTQFSICIIATASVLETNFRRKCPGMSISCKEKGHQ